MQTIQGSNLEVGKVLQERKPLRASPVIKRIARAGGLSNQVYVYVVISGKMTCRIVIKVARPKQDESVDVLVMVVKLKIE